MMQPYRENTKILSDQSYTVFLVESATASRDSVYRNNKYKYLLFGPTTLNPLF